jgi:hypothetical protein
LSAALLVALSSTSMAQDNRATRSMLFSPDARYAGKSLAEWGQDDWYRAVSIAGSAEDFPGINDGSSFGINQGGPVFFLGDSFNGSDKIPENDPNPGSTYTPDQRTITVPAYTALFIAFDAIYRAKRNGLPPGQTPEQALALVQDEFASSYHPVNVLLEIDGREEPIDSSANSPYHVSIILTGLPIPDDSFYLAFRGWALLVPPVLPYMLITEICALINPLSVGEHTINVRTFDAGWVTHTPNSRPSTVTSR